MARAVYSSSSIYLLDDPLSAVDSHVGKDIFDKVIGPNGLLKDKTRLFVTNSLSFLPQTDEIFMVEDGRIVEIGKYEDLLGKGGEFAEFIKNYLSNNEANSEKENEVNLDETNNEAAVSVDGKRGSITKLNASAVSLNKSLKRTPSMKPNEGADGDQQVNKPKGENIIQKEKIETGTVNFGLFLDI